LSSVLPKKKPERSFVDSENGKCKRKLIRSNKIKGSKGKRKRKRVSKKSSSSKAMSSKEDIKIIAFDLNEIMEVNSVWKKVKFNGHRTSSLGARAINYDNILQSFQEMVLSNRDNSHMAYEWIMYNVRKVGELLSERQSSITTLIKSADQSTKSDLRKERLTIQYMRSTIDSFKRKQGIEFNYKYPLWLAVVDEMFKFKLIDYSVYYLIEETNNQSTCSIKFDLKSDNNKIFILFSIIIRSMPIINPCREYTMSTNDLMILLGWLLNYRQDLIDLLNLSNDEMNNLNSSSDGMQKQLIIILNDIFTLCCNCKCYEESGQVIKTGNNHWKQG